MKKILSFFLFYCIAKTYRDCAVIFYKNFSLFSIMILSLNLAVKDKRRLDNSD